MIHVLHEMRHNTHILGEKKNCLHVSWGKGEIEWRGYPWEESNVHVSWGEGNAVRRRLAWPRAARRPVQVCCVLLRRPFETSVTVSYL